MWGFDELELSAFFGSNLISTWSGDSCPLPHALEESHFPPSLFKKARTFEKRLSQFLESYNNRTVYLIFPPFASRPLTSAYRSCNEIDY